MNNEDWLYLEKLIDGVPQYVYEGLLSVFCLGTVLLIVIKGKKCFRGVCKLLFYEYIFLVYSSTVFFREPNEEIKFMLSPFWSYQDPEIVLQIVMNVVVFVPIGFLLGCAFTRMTWWKAFIIGGGISFFIELFQYLLKRGLSETDDIIHNTLGCMIGYGLCELLKICCIYFSRVKNENMA